MKIIAYFPVLWPLFFAIAFIAFYQSHSDAIPAQAHSSTGHLTDIAEASVVTAAAEALLTYQLQMDSDGKLQIRNGATERSATWRWDGHQLTIDLNTLPLQDSLLVALDRL